MVFPILMNHPPSHNYFVYLWAGDKIFKGSDKTGFSDAVSVWFDFKKIYPGKKEFMFQEGMAIVLSSRPLEITTTEVCAIMDNLSSVVKFSEVLGSTEVIDATFI